MKKLLVLAFSVCLSAAINPQNQTLTAGQQVQFSMSSGVCTKWFIWGSYGGHAGIGTLSQTGLYTAPASIPQNQQVVIDCGNLFEDVILNLAQSSITVNVAISPTQVTLHPGQSQQFTATVSITQGQAMTFSTKRNEKPASQLLNLGTFKTATRATVDVDIDPVLNQGAVEHWLEVERDASPNTVRVKIVNTSLRPGIYKGRVLMKVDGKIRVQEVKLHVK